MDIIENEGRFPSTTGLADIFYRSWVPEGDVKAIIQISHGMAEHSERYDEFAHALCDENFAVFINDHIGHGKSVKTDDDLGYFGENDGWKAFIEDAKKLTDIARQQIPGKPVILYGHSMGSFVARSYVTKYGGDLAGAVFCGTSGPNPAAGIAIVLAGTIAKIKGSRHRSNFINKIAFGSYNNRYDKVYTEFDWLTRDHDIVKKYIEDRYCGFLFTAVGYRDMFTLLKSVSGKDWYEKVPKELPILVISGAMDPVGGFGKGTSTVANGLIDTGHNVKVKIYDGARHEILNEINNEDVFEDVEDWVEEIVE